jgi:geranylgeranyl diphosphate synthase type II
MALLAAQLFAEKITEEHWNVALAIEIFHNFTLVHDDIMDKADLRRGQPTVVKRFGENTAILAGDALLVKAYQHLCRSHNAEKILPVFNRAALEVCEGQQLDIDFEQMATIGLQQYFDVIGKKTAVLLAASCSIGALAAGADDADAACLYDFGYNLGIAFQVQDDLLDTYGDERTFGKAIGGDIVQGKKTYLFVATCKTLSAAGKKAFLNAFTDSQLADNQKISIIRDFYNEANVQQQSADTVKQFFEKSLLSLHRVNAPQKRIDALQYFAESLMGRNK